MKASITNVDQTGAGQRKQDKTEQKEQPERFEVKADSHSIPSKGFVKVYASSVPNTKVSLDGKVPVASFLELVSEPGQRNQLLEFGEVYMWDFGVRATKYLEPGDTLWIVTGEVAYEATLAFVIKDEEGHIGDKIGWSRQFKQPWKNVAILSSCIKHNQLPSWLRTYIAGNEDSLVKNFYTIKK